MQIQSVMHEPTLESKPGRRPGLRGVQPRRTWDRSSPTSRDSPTRSPTDPDDAPPGDLGAWRVLLPSHPRAERVARLVPHENASWDDASDLALLQLRAPVNLSAAPRPVCLPHPEHYFLPGSRCRLARWGRGGKRRPEAGWSGAEPRPTRPQRGVPCLSPQHTQNAHLAPGRCWRPSC